MLFIKNKSGPYAAQNLRGAKPIFQDLYVYIFVLLELIYIIYERIMCEKAWKSKKSTNFRARLSQKPGFLGFRASARENF